MSLVDLVNTQSILRLQNRRLTKYDDYDDRGFSGGPVGFSGLTRVPQVVDSSLNFMVTNKSKCSMPVLHMPDRFEHRAVPARELIDTRDNRDIIGMMTRDVGRFP